MAKDKPGSPTVTEHDASAYLALRDSTLRAWRQRGQGPAFVKLGRAVRYRVSDLDQYLESARVTPGRGDDHTR